MRRNSNKIRQILPIIILLLAIEIYAINVVDPIPANGSMGNPISAQIRFNIVSNVDTLGVDLGTIEVDVNGTQYSEGDSGFSYTSLGGYAGDSYRIIISSQTEYSYGDSINVEVSARDYSGVAMELYSWYFWVIDDNVAPLVWEQDPAPNETDVELDADIGFDVIDDVSGITPNDVSVHVGTTGSGMDATYEIGTNLTYQSISGGYRFVLDIDDDFVISDTVTVSVTAEDEAGNSVVEEYDFYVISSLNYTYTGNYDPLWNEQNVDVNTLVKFNIYNMVEDVYVDTLTIRVRIQGQQYTYANEGHFDLEAIDSPGGINQGYQVTVLPNNPFSYNQLVMVQIDADDTEGTHMETVNYSFRTVSDNTAPSWSNWTPYPDEDDVAVDTAISFDLKDLLSGVNIDSVKVWVDSLLYNNLDANFSAEDIENGYGISITPPAPFGSEQTVDIEIEAQDMLGNMLHDDYSFITEVVSEDSLPPFLLDIYPEDGAENLALNTEISFRIYDADPGIELESIEMRVNNTAVNATIEEDTAFGSTIQGYPVAYYVTCQIGVTNPGTVNWSVQASDANGNYYNGDWAENFNFSITASLPPYINLPGEFIFLEDNTLEVDFSDYAGDPDGLFPVLSYFGNSNISISINESVVTFDSPLNWYGSEVVEFEVTDGIGSPVSDNVTITVIAVNDAPVINIPVDNYTLMEDSELDVDFSSFVSDVDEDELLLQASGMDHVNIGVNDLTVHISAEQDWYGEEDVTFTVYDNAGRLSASETIAIIFESVDEPPEWQNLPGVFILSEDGEETIDFAQYIYEPEGQEVHLSVSDVNEVDIDIAGTMVTMSAEDNWTGDDAVTFLVSDSTSAWIDGETIVRVIPVNDAPEFDLPESVSIAEDSLLIMNFASYVSDVDGDPVYLSSYGNQNIAVDIDSLMVVLTPDGDWNGSENIAFIAQDAAGASVLQELAVNVTPVNDAPVVAFPPYLEFYEDSNGVFDLNNYISDIDGDELSINIAGNDSISYELTEMELSLTAPENWTGNELFYFNINDGLVSVNSEVQVRVISVNDAPVMLLPASISFNEDESLEVSFTDSLWVEDVDADDIAILPSGNNHILTQVVSGDIVIFTAEDNWNGSEDITFLAIDNNGGVSSGEITVIVNPVNDMPEINLPGEFTFAEGTTLDINMGQYLDDVDLYDEESEELLQLSYAGNVNVTIAVDGLNVQFGSVPDWNGTENITFTVSDFEGLEAADNVNVQVSIWQNNHAPELIEPISSMVFAEDSELVVNFVSDSLIVDIDGDELLVSILNNNHIQAEEDGAVVTFSADANWNGMETVGFFVDDQNGGFVQGELSFIVTPEDDILVFELPNNFDFEEGDNLIVDLNEYITDVDDDELQLEFTGNDTIDIEVVGPMTVNMQVMGVWTGSELVHFTIDDGFMAVTDSVNIIVTQGTWNHAPIFVDLPATFEFDEDTVFNYDFTAHIFDSDPDDEFILTVSDVSPDLQYQVNGLEVTMWGEENWHDDDMVLFTVYDTEPSGGRASATAYINVIVNSVNDAPVISLPDYLTFEQDSDLTVDFSNYISDVDGTQPELTGESGNNVFIEIVGTTVTFDATADWFGTDTLSFSVSDGEYSAGDELEVIVTEGTWNTPPEIVGLPDSVSYNEDEQYIFDFNPYVIDDDGDQWIVTFDYNQNVGATVNNNIVTFRSAANWNGTVNMGFTVHELRSRDEVTGEIDVIVNPVNDAPVITLPEQFIIGENEELVQPFTDYLFDVDGDNLTLAVIGNDTIDVEIIPGNVVSFTPPADWFGTEVMTFTVIDEDSLSSSDVINIIVEQGDFNHAPEMELPEEIVLDEDTQLEVDFSQYISDPDGDDLVLTGEYNENVLVVIEGMDVTFIPSLNYHGEVDIDFTVYDTEQGSRFAVNGEVTLVINSVNDTPELDLPMEWDFEENSQLVVDFGLYLYDADNEILDISWTGNINITIFEGADYAVTIGSAAGWSGSEMVYFTVTDNQLASAADSVEITVNAGQFNTLPEFTLPDTLYMQEDTAAEYDFSPYLYDADGDDLIITMAYNAHLSADITDSLVTLYPAENYSGLENVEFTVYDSHSERAAVSSSVYIDIAAVNDIPAIDLPNRFTFSSGPEPQLIDFAPFISDPDGEVLSITFSGNNEINVSIAYPQVIFTAAEDVSISENITFRVTDGEGEFAEDTVVVQAVSGDTNTPPEISLPEQFIFEEDTVYEVDFVAAGYISDIDEDQLSLLAYGNENINIEITGSLVALSPVENWNGIEDITFYVFDDMSRETASSEVEVVVTAVNDAPIISLPPEFRFVEEESLDAVVISNYLSDPDEDDELTLSVAGDGNIIVDISHLGNNTILADFSAVQGFVGIDTLTFTVSDDSLFSSDDVMINVEAGEWNHAPQFTEFMPEAVTIIEDSLYFADFTDFVEDQDDSDDIVLTVRNVDNMDIVIDDMEVTITPDANWFGNTDITFVAYDTESRSEVSAVLDFTVLPQNDAPVLNLPDYLSFEEDSSLNINFADYFSDIDGDDVLVSWLGNENLIIEQGVGYNVIISEDDYIGIEEITFTITDDSLAADSETITIEVLAGQWNHTPVIEFTEPFVLIEDTPVQINFSPFIFDEDENDLLIITAEYNENIMVTIMQDTLVTLSPVENYNGTTMMTFNVIDNVIDRAVASAEVEVTVQAVNDAPVIELPAELSMTQEETLGENFAFFVNDVDSDDLYLTHGTSEHLDIQIAGLYVTITNADEEWFGDEEISFTVMDDSLLSAEDSMIIRVYQGSMNTPPEINLPDNFIFDEDGELIVDFMAEGYISDAEDDDLFISVTGNHNIIAEIDDYQVTITAEENWFGTETVLFYVFDDMAGRSTASAETEVIVNPVNDPPVIDLPISFVISEDALNPEESLNLTAYIYDIDSSNLQLSVSGNEHLQIEVVQGSFVINISAEEAFVDTETVTFTVIDDSLAEGFDTTDIIIEAGDDNHPPTINLPDVLEIVEDTQTVINFSSYVGDLDGDDIVITLAENYENLQFDVNELYVTITPAADWNGVEEVEFVIYDTEDRASASDNVDIEVLAVNDAPEMVLPESIVFEENSTYTADFADYMTDVDGDLLTISWQQTENINISSLGYNVFFSASESWFGEEMVTFSAADDSTAAIDSLLVIVEQGDWNHEPVLTLPDGWSMAEDTQLQIDFTPFMGDVDDDELQLFSAYNQYIDIVIEDNMVTFIPEDNYFGSQQLEFRLIDNVIGRAIVIDTATLDVTAVNDAPELDLPTNLGFSQADELYDNFMQYIEDIDSSDLTLEFTGNNNIEITEDNMIVHFELYEASDDWYGMEMITFTVRDDSLAAAVDSVMVTVYQGGVNNPPEITLPATVNFDEDNTLSLDFAGLGYVSDIDGDQLSLTVSGNENVTVDIFGTYVTLGALENWNGNEELTFWVIDEEGQAESDQLWVQVAEINDPPVIELPYEFSFQEGSTGTIVISDYFSDIDSENLTVNFSGEDHVSVVINEVGTVNINYVAEFTPEEDWTGSDTLSFTIIDDDLASGTDEMIITVEPGEWNHAPVLELPEEVTIHEDEVFEFDLTQYMYDVDDDYLLVYPQGSNHLNVSIDADTMVTVIPSENWYGTETISFTIHDSDPAQRISAFDEMVITVLSVNDLPELTLPETIEFYENESLLVDFDDFASDVETDFLTIGFSGNDTISVQVQGYSLLLTAPQSWTGEEYITFSATDDSLQTVADSTLVKVLLGNFNHAPEISLPQEGFSCVEDNSLDVDFAPYIFDPDGDALILDAGLDSDISIDVVGSMVTFIPDTNFNGSKTITFTVIDNIGRLQASDEVTITVTPANDPPVLTLPPELSLSINSPESFNFTSFITDIDMGDSHTLTHSGNQHIQVDIEGLWVSLVSSWVGSEWISFTVEDSYGATATDSVEIYVFAQQANNDPVIDLPDVLTYNEDTFYEIDFNQYISDIDGDDLELLVTGNSMVEVDIAGNEVVTFSAADNWYGTEELTFIVTDSYSFSTDEIEIEVQPVNDAPTINLPSSFTFSENTTLDVPFDLYMDDIDGDPLNISFEGNDNVDIEIINSTVRLSCSGWYGVVNINFTVDDGIEAASDEVEVTVEPGVENHPPVLDLPATFTTEEDQVLVIDMTPFISDLDEDAMIINVNGEQHSDVDIYGYDVYINPEDNWYGTETLTFIVYDDVRSRASDAASADIIVTPVNDEPSIELPAAGFEFSENGSLLLDFNLYVNDVDNDPLTLECTDNESVTVQINNLSVNLGAVSWWSGSEVLTFSVADGNGGSSSDQVDIAVNFVNDAPYVLEPLDNFSMDEDSSYSLIDLHQVFADHDLEFGDELTYNCLDDINLDVIILDGMVTITPDLNWFGSETITFRATDSEDLFVEESVNVLVNSVNDIPVVVVEESITAQAGAEGFANVWLDANGSWDVDGEIVNVLWSWDGGSIEGMVVQQAFAPGYYEITVQATDNQSGVGEAVTYLSVADYNNQSPVAIDDFYEVYETSELIVYATEGLLANDYDPDETPDELTAILVNQPTDGTLIQFNPNGSFIYLADDIINHDVTFSYQAYDGQAYSLIRTVHITVHEIVLEDAEITINSINEDSTGTVLTVPILTSDLIPDWDVRSFEFDLNFTDGVIEYAGFDLENAIVDSMGIVQIQQTRGAIHCIYSSDDVITGTGALLNLNFDYFLGHSPLQITNFFFNQTSIDGLNPGAVNNHYPQLVQAIILDTLEEDFSTYTEDLDIHFDDLDGDELSYSVDYDEDEIIAEINDNLLVLNSVSNWTGTTAVTLTATDNYTLTEPEVYTFYPEIQPVNDAPQIILPDYISFPEDSSLVVNMADYITDPDPDDLLISWHGNSEIIINGDDMQITFSAAADWFGSEVITFEVDDQVTGRLVAVDSMQVMVTPVNDNPVFDLPVSITFDEDEGTTLDFVAEGYVYDLENDNITLTATGNDSIIIEITGTEVAISSPLNWFGTEDIMFYAQDDQGSDMVSAGLQVIVHSLNDPPVIELPRNIFIYENSLFEENTYNFADSLWISDPDENILTLTVDDGEFIDIEIEGSFVSFEPMENWTGREDRVFTVNDGQERLTSSDMLQIFVIEDTLGNVPPVIELPEAGISYLEDEQLIVNFSDSLTACYVYDPDDDDVVLIVDNTENITASVNGMAVTFGTAPDFFGADEVVITAVDNISRAVSFDTLLINVSPVNDPPQIDLPENIVLVGDTTRVINFQQYLTDIDNTPNELSLSAEGDENVQLEIFNTVVSFVSPANWEGEEIIYFSVLDNGAVPGQDSLLVIVEQEDINHVPQIALPASFAFDEDSSLQIDFNQYISDEDGDQLFLNASPNDNITVIIDEQNNVTLSALEDWSGSENIIFTVYDSQTRASAFEDVQITVNPVNDPPRFDPVYDYIMEQDQVLEIDFEDYVYDIEENSFELSLSIGTGLNITQDEYQFTIIPDTDCPPVQSLTLTATEFTAGIYSEIMFGLHVKEPAVDISAIEDAVTDGMFTFTENSESHTIDFAQFLQADYDLQLTSGLTQYTDTDSLDVQINGLTVTFTPKENWIGTIYVPFTITYLYDRARRDFEVKVTIKAAKNGEYIEIQPHLVTWKWQYCNIIATTGEPPGNITAKILNRRGKLIKELNSEPQILGDGRLNYQWDKTDIDGNPVDGGLYIYQIDINGKLYQGTIIIVR